MADVFLRLLEAKGTQAKKLSSVHRHGQTANTLNDSA